LDKIQIASKELEKYNVKIVYVQVQCNRCTRKWAAYIPEGRISIEKLICRNCESEEKKDQQNTIL
jgi:hypothetical protein